MTGSVIYDLRSGEGGRVLKGDLSGNVEAVGSLEERHCACEMKSADTVGGSGTSGLRVRGTHFIRLAMFSASSRRQSASRRFKFSYKLRYTSGYGYVRGCGTRNVGLDSALASTLSRLLSHIAQLVLGERLAYRALVPRQARVVQISHPLFTCVYRDPLHT